MGVGERRQAGTARDFALPTSPRQETGHSSKSTREGLPNRGVVSDTQQCLRRDGGDVSGDRWDSSPTWELLRTGEIMDPTYAESCGLKRGGRFQRWEFLHNPLKKARGLEFLYNPSAVLEETWIGQNLQERRLLIEWAIYTEGTTMKGSSGSQRLGGGLEAVCADVHVQDKQSESSNQARGGGGWPSTAARSP
ncbi:unnamed protein product [Malus baccata var. baccata]